MKKFAYIVMIAAGLAVSCNKTFDSVGTTSYLSGDDAIEMVDQNPDFLYSYVSGFYSWMVLQCQVYSGHDDYGFLSCTMIADFMGQDIAMANGQHYGMYDYIHDYCQEEYVRCRQIWTQFYTLINNANSVINFFEPDVDPEGTKARGYLGQAYAIRAFAYYYLMAYFQDPVDADGNLRTDAKCVPIIPSTRDNCTTEEAEQLQSRNTIATVMARIEADLDEALKLLDGYTRSAKNEIDLSVAKGIAARYYLYVQNWEKASKYAGEACTGYSLMDETRLKAGFKEIEDEEVMWGFNHTADTYGMYASFASHMCNDHAGYASIMYKCIDAKLYSQIPDTDLRKGLFNGPEGDAEAATAASAYPYASRKFGYDENWLQDFIYMRAAEMYLIKAEAEARLNNSTEATNALKSLLAYRNPSWKGSATVEEVLLQRRIELWGEGFSYFDLKRNGLGIDRNYEGTNHATWGRLAFPAHDNTWTFQIPRSELQNNLMINDEDQNEL
ncbi:MAG: RagB/SusD family nutrient uptake outer membrane protein [Candidatus Cryptobacteroides sp.]